MVGKVDKGCMDKAALTGSCKMGNRMNRIPVSLHLAQTLTGHGCFFHQYFSKWDHWRACIFTCAASSDTVEHTIFDCIHWTNKRIWLTGILRRAIKPEDVKELLCRLEAGLLPEDSDQAQKLLAEAGHHQFTFLEIYTILTSKEDDARERQILDRSI